MDVNFEHDRSVPRRPNSAAPGSCRVVLRVHRISAHAAFSHQCMGRKTILADPHYGSGSRERTGKRIDTTRLKRIELAHVWYGLSVRVWTTLSLIMIGSIASADQLIDIPTARKILFEDVRYEFRAEPVVRGDIQHFLGIGIGKSFELDVREIQNSGTSPVGTFDFSYNFITAFPGGAAPGVSFGVQDAENLTKDGRRFYAVTTFRNGLDELSGNLYADVTLGFQCGSLTSPFVGVSLPFSNTVYLLAEDSGFRVSAGIGFHPAPKIDVRFITRDQKMLLSVSATSRF